MFSIAFKCNAAAVPVVDGGRVVVGEVVVVGGIGTQSLQDWSSGLHL